MKIVILRGIHRKSTTLSIPLWARVTISCCLLGVPLGVGAWFGYEFLGKDDNDFFVDIADSLEKDLAAKQVELAEVRDNAEYQLQAMSLKMAKMQVHLSRLEALGEVLTVRAKLEDGEFDFGSAPALGGPDLGGPAVEMSQNDILAGIDQFATHLGDRQLQLEMVADLIQDQHLQDEGKPSGLPTKKGWVSSRYGNRIDPFTGKSAWHDGIDIAGKHGADIFAVASGVVTFSGDRYGYGNLVEITHDNGYVTRYGHNSELVVSRGEVVRKGQVISKMGTTGRSTGPHIHFEVFKNGRTVDPASYIRGNAR